MQRSWLQPSDTESSAGSWRAHWHTQTSLELVYSLAALIFNFTKSGRERRWNELLQQQVSDGQWNTRQLTAIKDCHVAEGCSSGEDEQIAGLRQVKADAECQIRWREKVWCWLDNKQLNGHRETASVIHLTLGRGRFNIVTEEKGGFDMYLWTRWRHKPETASCFSTITWL